MFKSVLVCVLMIGGVSAAIAEPSCKGVATGKKLAGAAMTSFMTKCEKDARSTCDASATSRKLAGAARTSFTKKCVTDAVGS